MLTAAQKKARMAGVGGSDVAVIMGLSPWKSKYQLFMEKTGQLEEEDLEGKEAVHFGSVLEDVVADEYSRRTGEKVQRRTEHFTHPKHPFLMANIDRKIVGRKAVLECKTADKYSRGNWGDDGSDIIPDYYRVQLEHYMNVLDYGEGVMAVLIGGNEFRQYPINRDPEISGMLIEGCVKFWEAVKARKEPEIDFDHPTTGAMLKRIYPGTNGQTIILPESIEPWLAVRAQAEERIKEDKAVVDACKNRLAAIMGDSAIAITADKSFQYKRGLVKVKEYVNAANEYYSTRKSKYTEKKS